MADDVISKEELHLHKVRLQPEPSFVLPIPQIALRQRISDERLSSLCTNFPKEEFQRRCYREASVMPGLVSSSTSTDGIFSTEKMYPHLRYERHQVKPPETLTDVFGAASLQPAAPSSGPGKGRKKSGIALKITEIQREDLFKLKCPPVPHDNLIEEVAFATNTMRQDPSIYAGEDMKRQPASPRPSQQLCSPILTKATTAQLGSAAQPPMSQMTPPGSAAMVEELAAAMADWPPKVRPEDLRDELEIGLVLGTLNPQSSAELSAALRPALPRRSLPQAKANMLSRATKNAKASTSKVPRAAAALVPGEGPAWLQDEEKTTASIGARLYRLGLNPLRRRSGHASKVKFYDISLGGGKKSKTLKAWSA